MTKKKKYLIRLNPLIWKAPRTLFKNITKIGKDYLEITPHRYVKTWNGSLRIAEINWALKTWFMGKIDYNKGENLRTEIYDIPYNNTKPVLIDYYELEGVRIIKTEKMIIIISDMKNIILHGKIIENYVWILHGLKVKFELKINEKIYTAKSHKYSAILSTLLSSKTSTLNTTIKAKDFDTQSFFINGTRNKKSIEKNRVIIYK